MNRRAFIVTAIGSVAGLLGPARRALDFPPLPVRPIHDFSRGSKTTCYSPDVVVDCKLCTATKQQCPWGDGPDTPGVGCYRLLVNVQGGA